MSGGPEARARIAALSAAFKNRVADYLEVHGPATNAAMCEALGCEERYLRSKLSVMCAEGIAHSRRVPAPGRAPLDGALLLRTGRWRLQQRGHTAHGKQVEAAKDQA